jgi:hypothetical protein
LQYKNVNQKNLATNWRAITALLPLKTIWIFLSRFESSAVISFLISPKVEKKRGLCWIKSDISPTPSPLEPRMSYLGTQQGIPHHKRDEAF